MSFALVFPGQGSQAVGMGRALAENFPAARQAFEEIDAALGEKLTTIMWEGPAETLTLTENAQPALMAVSVAALRVLESEAGFDISREAAFLAGHSLGEYSALVAAGSLDPADGARLVRIRGRVRGTHRLFVKQHGLGLEIPILVVAEVMRRPELAQRKARGGVPRSLPTPAVISELRQPLLDALAVGAIERIHVGARRRRINRLDRRHAVLLTRAGSHRQC